MINLTEEDVNYIYTNMFQPVIAEIAQGVANTEDEQNKIINRMFDAVCDAISDIRYKQERDRRFYKAMFTQVFEKPADAYDEFYKTWCEEFDKLNKEKNE